MQTKQYGVERQPSQRVRDALNRRFPPASAHCAVGPGRRPLGRASGTDVPSLGPTLAARTIRRLARAGPSLAGQVRAAPLLDRAGHAGGAAGASASIHRTGADLVGRGSGDPGLASPRALAPVRPSASHHSPAGQAGPDQPSPAGFPRVELHLVYNDHRHDPDGDRRLSSLYGRRREPQGGKAAMYLLPAALAAACRRLDSDG